jgi:hypothetical protein
LQGVVIYVLLPPKSASILWYPSEYSYIDPKKGDKKQDFEGLSAAPAVDVSLIAPAYNESQRLPSIHSINLSCDLLTSITLIMK